jgi:cell envelope opacity-associated protein A
MSIFGSIMTKIFHHGAPEQNVPTTGAPAAATPAAAQTTASASPAAATPAAASQPVDVEAVLTQMAAQKSGGGNWQTSVVDLLKLLDPIRA